MVIISVKDPESLAYVISLVNAKGFIVYNIRSAPLVHYGFSTPVTTFKCSNGILKFSHILESLGADIVTSHEQSGQV
jgi:hypothetical protein